MSTTASAETTRLLADVDRMAASAFAAHLAEDCASGTPRRYGAGRPSNAR